ELGILLDQCQIWTDDAYAVRQLAFTPPPKIIFDEQRPFQSWQQPTESPHCLHREGEQPDWCSWVIPTELAEHCRDSPLHFTAPVVGVLGLDHQTDRDVVSPGVPNHDHQFPQGDQLPLLGFWIATPSRAERGLR